MPGIVHFYMKECILYQAVIPDEKGIIPITTCSTSSSSTPNKNKEDAPKQQGTHILVTQGKKGHTMNTPPLDNTDQEIRRLVETACKVWVKKLTDYSRTNTMLFYRDLKVGTLDLTSAEGAVDRLLDGEELNAEILQDKAKDADTIHHALLTIQRKALSNLEEKGIETLYIALGLATWPTPDGGRPYAAPVVLLPVHIKARGRGSITLHRFFLKVAGEPQLNPVLLHILQENYNISIDVEHLLQAKNLDNSSVHHLINPELIFNSIEVAAKPIANFTIQRRVILANFYFNKMAIVEDLKRNLETIASNPLIAAIAGHLPSRAKLSREVASITPHQLDEMPITSDYLVLDADSSQQRAIVLASIGQSLIMHGPPGTGKSQTIANLIAQSVAEGRRVLFVAEKRAALEAVIKRLQQPEVGLGHLVLDLHSADLSRKEVMEQIARTLEQIRNTPRVTEEESLSQFQSKRRQLNAHVLRVNQPRQPTGLSVYTMIGELLRLPETVKSDVRLRNATLDAFTKENVNTYIYEWLREASDAPNLFLGTDSSPWNNADIRDGQRAQEAIDLAIHAANTLWPEFERRLKQVTDQIGMQYPNTMAEVASFLKVLSDMHQFCQLYSNDIFSLDLGELGRQLEPADRGVFARIWAFLSRTTYRAARKRLLALRATPAASNILRQEVLSAMEILQRWQALRPASLLPVQNNAEQELRGVFNELTKAIGQLSAFTKAGLSDTLPLADMAYKLQALAQDRRSPMLLPNIHKLRTHFSQVGLDNFIDDLRRNRVSTQDWIDRFKYVWLSSSLEQVFFSDSGLAAFNGRTHEQIIAEFQWMDRERICLAACRVRRIHAERAIEAMNQYPEQTNLIRTEVTKRTRHISVRDLLARAPDVLTRIAPCWVASPLSVSQLLDGSKRHFDLVVFDEASQILQEEAISALYRAGQVVVAGDQHQLPPTTFFATMIEDENDISEEDTDEQKKVDESISGFESLLDTLQSFLPSILLEWHYRSKDERLISFSNHHIYSGRLITFPSICDEKPITHILVSHDPSLGGQEESASREVEAVVQQILLHAETRPHESLGVITMGIKHAQRIQVALDRTLVQHPDLEEFFALDRSERFFVKNLETVQGDERDAIILSIGYGKTATGDLPHRFGPLTQDVGYRRLNVAITRARRRMCVISSFSHQEIDLNRSDSRGVRLLKAYLEYAASGGQRFPEVERAGEVSLNPFEADVRDALEKKGIPTRAQFGVSRYRIDLVAMHPRRQGRPVLAIECDGASYHSSPTARDRDRLRQENLEQLGWRFHRIWSTDWFHHREQEIQRAVAAYEAAVHMADIADANNLSHISGTRQTPHLDTQVPSPQQRGPRPQVSSRASIDEYSDLELIMLVEWVGSDGLLRTDEEWCQEVLQLLPFTRLGNRIKYRLTRAINIVKEHQQKK
jgi:very-short-patch-repair endonuclease/DNA polymerase III delta prime subunit